MGGSDDREFVKAVLERNRYLVMSTTDGSDPWIAPLEYMMDDDLNFYFLSTDDARHIRDLAKNEKVAVAVYDQEQPDYSADATFTLNGVQMEAVCRRVPEEDYTEAIQGAIDALSPPMPPYAVFKIEPRRFFIPRIEDGVNVRSEASVDEA